jgi:DNA-binding response OmpR family regulator
MEHLPARVLVLEDDELIRELVADMLRDDGIDVDTVGDPLSALEKIDAGDFDLIIADVWLPGAVDGVEAVRCARARHPSLRSLFISGKNMPELEDPRADEFVQKPFDSRELLGCVWELLLREGPQRCESGTRRAAARFVAAAKVDSLRRLRSGA